MSSVPGTTAHNPSFRMPSGGFVEDRPSKIIEMTGPFHWPTMNGDPFGKPSEADKIIPLCTGVLPETNLIPDSNGSEDPVPWHVV